ncbi:MAG: energy transducer TonB [bacterium]
MLKDTRQNIAFLISLGIHILILVSISLFSVYQKKMVYTLTEVELIGTSLFPQGSLQYKSQVPYQIKSLTEKENFTDVKIEQEKNIITKEKFSIFKKDIEKPLEKKESKPIFNNLKEIEKAVAPQIQEIEKLVYTEPAGVENAAQFGEFAGKLNISGPITEAKRNIIHREKFEHSKQIAIAISLKFWVEPDGRVSTVIPLQKGDTNLEKKAIEILKKWRFESLPRNAKQERQWGIIPLKYILK